MFSFFKKTTYFVVQQINDKSNYVLVEDLSSGKKIKIPFGSNELHSAEFTDDYLLELTYKDGRKKITNINKYRQE